MRHLQHSDFSCGFFLILRLYYQTGTNWTERMLYDALTALDGLTQTP